MFLWQFHFVNENSPLNCLFTQLFIFNFGPWRWSAFNMGLLDKWPSRMQGQWFFRSRASGQQFSVKYKNTGYCGRMATPAQIYLPRKVCEGEFNVPPNDVDGTNPLTMLQIIYNKYYIALITRKDIYMSSKNYKANGYDHDSNLITISH